MNPTLIGIDALEEFTYSLNNQCKNLQECEKEFVSDLYAFEALAIVKNMRIEDAGDALLYCAAMNLLNTYVKQKGSKVGYSFKEEIHYMTSILLNLDIDDVYIDYQDSESLLVVQIFCIQFSFHYIRKRREIRQLCQSHHYKELEWDGIRKQKCAVSLYSSVRNNNIRTCGLTFRGKPLSKKIDRMIEQYKEGKISFADFRRR